MKSLVLFFVMFVVGAAIALGTRTVLHEPYAETAASALTPATARDPNATHAQASITQPASDAKPVNTVCAICGMDVDPAIKPAVYQGKLVGFGCATCPAKFANDPERYGPSALRNEVAK